jgi:Putative peptidoglycan binding domain
VGTRGGGVGFGMGRNIPYQSLPSSTVRAARTGRSVNSIVGRTAGKRSTAPVVTQNRPTVVPNRPAAGTPAVRGPGNVAQRGLNGRTDHIYGRHDQSWHQDWDHHRAHYSHNHWWVYDSGAWIGLDDGFFPWDYYPYYAFDYYPYDYYPGYYADVEPYYNNEGVTYANVPAPDPTVAAVQTQLVQLGYYNGPADGIYGPLTRDAVARYQTAKNIPVTGSLSASTLQSLGVPGLASN